VQPLHVAGDEPIVERVHAGVVGAPLVDPDPALEELEAEEVRRSAIVVASFGVGSAIVVRASPVLGGRVTSR